MTNQQGNYKWYILTLVVLTNMLAVAIPSMGMSVLSKEIADDLGLSLVQVGIVWGVGGCIQGLLGYLPLYLRTLGWEALRADGALSAFHTSSMIFVLPIALWSDRLGSRK